MGDFDRAITFVLAEEGGYVNNPNDPGGETKFGISKRSYPNVDIAALTEDQARAIYYTDYWLRSGADALPDPLALVVFDSAVNAGLVRAQTWLDQSGGDLETYLALRQDYYDQLASDNPKLATFLAGWTNRVKSLGVQAKEYL